MRTRFKVLLGVLVPLIALASAIAVPFIALGIKDARMNANYDYLKEDAQYSHKVEVAGLNLVTQKISCGYASIEMMAGYYGEKVSEEDLDKKNNGGVSTSSTDGFLKEINASIKTKQFKNGVFLQNDEFLKKIHLSLSKSNPVAIEWAAKYDGEWTLHFSLVSALDLSNDQVIVYNPYGYIEKLSVSSFLDRTTFKAFEGMPMLYNFGFAFGSFHKNALFFANEG